MTHKQQSFQRHTLNVYPILLAGSPFFGKAPGKSTGN